MRSRRSSLEPVAKPADDDFRLFYEENGRVTAVFWEWRHKVIMLCALTLAGVLGIASWLYERNLGDWVAVPFGFGSVIFYLCALFDHRIAQVLTRGYDIGDALEQKAIDSKGLAAKQVGIYQGFSHRDVPAEGRLRRLWCRLLGRPESETKPQKMDAKEPPPGTFTLMLRRTYRSLMAIFGVAALVTLVVALDKPSALRRFGDEQASQRSGSSAHVSSSTHVVTVTVAANGHATTPTATVGAP
jgi:hypothetical protein